MYVIQNNQSLPAKELSPEQAKTLSSNLAQLILKTLSENQSYPKQIAKTLQVHEQKIYYHIRKLEKANIIEQTETKIIGGTPAHYYKLKQPAFIIKFKEFQTSQHLTEPKKEEKAFLEPFIEDGQLNASIIVGSPDPHGPEKARSRDGYYAIDLALFLGSYLNYIPQLNVKLDTETRQEDLQNNLILIGGPVVNTITEKINSTLPIKFIKKENWMVHSTISKKEYRSDTIGIITKIKSPFNPKKSILLIAGKRNTGTRTCIIAFLKHFKEIIKGNKHQPKTFAKVIEGLDMNADGIVDEVEFLE
tara:strand:- start:1187 stop:2098 length:912 start_codon:yes stop_codon:yes gene_type:complete